MSISKVPTAAVLVSAVLGFVAIIAAYVVLVALGHGTEAAGLIPTVITLLGFVGLGAHNANRLGQQDDKLDQITHQTNGVLTGRIEEGADRALRKVLTEAGYNVPLAAPADPLPEDSGQ